MIRQKWCIVQLTSSVKAVAKSTKLSTYGLEHRLKTKDSFLRKIRAEYKPDGNTYEIRDIIRYTLGTENPDDLVERMFILNSGEVRRSMIKYN